MSTLEQFYHAEFEEAVLASGAEALCRLGKYVKNNFDGQLKTPYRADKDSEPLGKLVITVSETSFDRPGDGPCTFRYLIQLSDGDRVLIETSEGTPSIEVSVNNSPPLQFSENDVMTKLAPIIRKINTSLAAAYDARVDELKEAAGVERIKILEALDQF